MMMDVDYPRRRRRSPSPGPFIVHRPFGAVGPPANERLLNHAVCLNHILDYSTIREVVCFALTSKELRWRVDNYIEWRYAILLKRWIADPIEFRKVLKLTSSVISGSTALAFMLGAPWTTGDIDIYVPKGTIGLLLRSYLVKEEKYVVETLHPVWVKAEGYPDATKSSTNMANVYQLSKTVTNRWGERTTVSIDVIESKTDQAIAPIFRFHSSSVMNWISADAFCMTYPNLTCDNVAIVNQVQYSTAAKVGKWRAKYVERGFKFYDSPAEMPRQRPCGVGCPLIKRSTEDVGCLVHHFNRKVPVEKVPAVKWTLYEAEDGQRVVQCLNPYCPRSFALLNKRGGGKFEEDE